MSFAQTEYGVAPIWEPTSDGDYTPTKQCIGFYVEGAGDVTFTSNGTDITRYFQAYQIVPAQISAFKASGTTATGICALVI